MTTDQTMMARLMRVQHSLEVALAELDRMELSLIAAQLSLPLELLKAELAQIVAATDATEPPLP
jgi:hypothetical protein